LGLAPPDGQEVKGALKVSGRSLGLVLVGALLLQLPFGTAWLSVPAAVIAVFVFVYALAGLLFAAMLWRSLLWRALSPRNETANRIVFTAAALLPLFAMGAGLYWAVGAILAP